MLNANDSTDPARSQGAIRFKRVLIAALAGTVITAVALTSIQKISPSADEQSAASPLPSDDGAKPVPAMTDTVAERVLRFGEALQRKGRLDQAVMAYQSIPSTLPKQAEQARVSTAMIQVAVAELSAAAKTLDELEAINPENPYLNQLRVSHLTAGGCRWQSRAYIRTAIERLIGLESFGEEDGSELVTALVFLTNLHSQPTPETDYMKRLKVVGDAYGMITLGRLAGSLGRHKDAIAFNLRAIELDRSLSEPFAQICERLLDLGRREEFAKWQSQLPADCEQHPQVWYTRGRYSHELEKFDEALRCYWEALRLDSNHDRAAYQIGQILASRGEIPSAQPFLSQANLGAQLKEQTELLYDSMGTKDSLLICANSCIQLGRVIEARAWTKLYNESDSRVAETSKQLERDIAKYSDTNAWAASDLNLAAKFSFASSPLPQFDLDLDRNSPTGKPSQPDTARLASTDRQSTEEFRFRDVADELGIQFLYHNGKDLDREGRLMYEYTGGGIGILDYDRDGLPDIVMTQGAQKPDATQLTTFDVLFRNGGEAFSEVAGDANLVDAGFGQGVAVGDYNSDGFQDIYVANLNGNQLYCNRGDGTFEDVTDTCGVGHEYWTTSCAMADLNGDGIADLYDVTFLQGDNVFTVICGDRNGRPRSCAPTGFEAAPDFVWLGQGDGTFMQAEPEAGFDVPNGDGLGIVVADMEGDSLPEIFIANDGRANFYFVPTTSGGERDVRWTEEGLFSGLAFDEEGDSQACMGVAADDLNGDGRLDLFVTNFYKESNVLYVNKGDGTFLDETRSWGLRVPSFLLLGFGTQFFDADLDSDADIFLVNGHVDDFSSTGSPYEMPPQFFENQGSQQFLERVSDDSADFRSTPRLGRSVARIDLEHDGRVDFVVSNLETPTSVVRNETETEASWVAFQLTATKTQRDAIGTTVELTLDGKTMVKQLTAGDGYQASNEKRLVFGLAGRRTPVKVTVRWPSGEIQVFDDVAMNADYHIVEGGMINSASL